jgi:hypothetical protein
MNEMKSYIMTTLELSAAKLTVMVELVQLKNRFDAELQLISAGIKKAILVPPRGTKIAFSLNYDVCKFLILLVGTARFELATPASRTLCSTRLSHVPT